jgi:acetyl-CoA acetyltransferase
LRSADELVKADKKRSAIVGVGYTPTWKQAPRSLGAIALEAALAAIEDAGLTREMIDGYVGTPWGPGSPASQPDGVAQISAGYLAGALGLRDLRFTVDIVGLPSTALEIAVNALRDGLCNYVLLLRAMYSGPAGVHSGGARAAGPLQFTLPYGLSGGGPQFALQLKRYMFEHGATREQLFAIVKLARRHAALNPVAYWRDKPVTLEEYMRSRWIYEPLSLLDCDLPVTTAGALIVTTAERARDLPHKPALVTGFAGTAAGRETVFEVSGVAREDVDVAQIYDGFSPFVWYWLEQLGFCAPGEAAAFAENGRLELDGDLPVNTAGGNLGEGHFQGFGHLREGAMQIMGRCGDRQVANARHCLVAAGQPTGSRSRHAIMLSAE